MRPAHISKDEAEYQDKPIAGERCGGCSMFREPDSCTLVAGEISPHGHCRYWQAKRR